MHRPGESPLPSPSIEQLPFHGPELRSGLDHRAPPPQPAEQRRAALRGWKDRAREQLPIVQPLSRSVLAGQDQDPGAVPQQPTQGHPSAGPQSSASRLHRRRGIGRVVGRDRRHHLPGFDEGPRLGRREAELAGRDVVELDQDLRQREEPPLAADQRGRKLDSTPCRSPAAPSAASTPSRFISTTMNARTSSSRVKQRAVPRRASPVEQDRRLRCAPSALSPWSSAAGFRAGQDGHGPARRRVMTIFLSPTSTSAEAASRVADRPRRPRTEPHAYG